MRQRLEEAAEEVFEYLGPGWSESVYHRALERELAQRGIAFHSEGTIPVMYKGAPVGRRRPDLFVLAEGGETIIVELKAGSTGGWFQLEQYIDLTEASEDLGYIRGGALIKFNEDVEMEFLELGPEPNPDDKELRYKKLKELPTGVHIYLVDNGEHKIQVNVDPSFEESTVEANALAEAKNDTELQQFHEAATDLLAEELFNDGEDG